MKKKKWKLNKKIVARNLIILLNLIVIGLVIYTIKTQGISYLSTIGYF